MENHIQKALQTILLEVFHSKRVSVEEGEIALLNSLNDTKLIDLLNDYFVEEKNPSVQSWIFDALLSIQNFDKVDFLVNKINQEQQITDWTYVYCKRLGGFDDERAIKKLCSILETSEDADLRFVAVEALAAIGNPIAIATLKFTSENDKGTDYEGFSVANVAKEAMKKILKSRKAV